jgi:hypothetical protein
MRTTARFSACLVSCLTLSSCIADNVDQLRSNATHTVDFTTQKDFRSVYSAITTMADRCWVVQYSLRSRSRVETHVDYDAQKAEVTDVWPLLFSPMYIYDVTIQGTPSGTKVSVAYTEAAVDDPYKRVANTVEDWVNGGQACSN